MKGSSKQLSSENRKKADQDWLKLCDFIEEMKLETSEAEASSDFEGTFQKDLNSNFRKRIKRIKTSNTDPIMLGKILAKTGSKLVPFFADTGCSVNILPARFAAAEGLR